MKTHVQIQQDVLNELEWDPRIEPTEVVSRSTTMS